MFFTIVQFRIEVDTPTNVPQIAKGAIFSWAHRNFCKKSGGNGDTGIPGDMSGKLGPV